MSRNNLFDPKLLARVKQGFVDASDASGGAGGDPAAAGGAPAGGDPSMGGGDPSAAGAPPPAADPSAGGGGSGDMAAMQAQLQAMQQQMATMGAGGAGAGGVEPVKPKVDVNVVLLQLLKMMAKVCDSMGIQIPLSDMVATSADLTGMAQQSEQGSVDPSGGAGGAGPIPPIQPMQGAAPGGGQAKSSSFNGGYSGSVYHPANLPSLTFGTDDSGYGSDLASQAAKMLAAASRR